VWQRATRTVHGLQFSILRKGETSVRITRKHRFSLIALLPLVLFAIPHSASAQSDGQKLYDTNCAKCHGPDGSGSTALGKAVGAKDLRSDEAKKLTDAEIFTQIDQGKGNMPPFGGTLNKAQINSLIPIIREFGKKAPAAGKKAGCCSRSGGE
jgi:mono/diheme cytochrome c family protein